MDGVVFEHFFHHCRSFFYYYSLFAFSKKCILVQHLMRYHRLGAKSTKNITFNIYKIKYNFYYILHGLIVYFYQMLLLFLCPSIFHAFPAEHFVSTILTLKSGIHFIPQHMLTFNR